MIPVIGLGPVVDGFGAEPWVDPEAIVTPQARRWQADRPAEAPWERPRGRLPEKGLAERLVIGRRPSRQERILFGLSASRGACRSARDAADHASAGVAIPISMSRDL